MLDRPAVGGLVGAAALLAVATAGAAKPAAADVPTVAVQVTGSVPTGTIKATMTGVRGGYTARVWVKGAPAGLAPTLVSNVLGPSQMNSKVVGKRLPLDGQLGQMLLSFAPAGASSVEATVTLLKNGSLKPVAAKRLSIPVTRPTVSGRILVSEGGETLLSDVAVGNAPDGKYEIALRPTTGSCRSVTADVFYSLTVSGHAGQLPLGRGGTCLDPATAVGQTASLGLVGADVGWPIEKLPAIVSSTPITIEALS